MAISSTGPISIKTASGTNRSIDAEVTSVSSGNLVTLSLNAIPAKTSPHGMLEFLGYSHRWYTTGTVDEVTENKIIRYELTLSDMTPDNAGGTITDIVTFPGGNGFRLFWSGSRNDNWTSLKIGATEGTAVTILRSSLTHDGLVQKTTDAGTYITNTDNASMFFEMIV